MPGWLAFVIVAFTIGNAAGMVTLKASEGENGQSRQADQILSQQYPRARAKEEVLVESQSGRLPVAEYRRAVTEMVSRLSHTPAVARIRSPLAPGYQGQVSKDGHAALLTFQIAGDPMTAQDRVARSLAVTAPVQRAHPGTSSASSATEALTRQSANASARTSSRPRSLSCRSRCSFSCSRSARSSPPASRRYSG